jgi:hypothetical protein
MSWSTFWRSPDEKKLELFVFMDVGCCADIDSHSLINWPGLKRPMLIA